MNSTGNWDLVIKPKSKWFELDFRSLWSYRDLLRMFVKRDIIILYKQTILGPVWFFVQPLLTTVIYVLVFGKIAKLSTDGLPQILFYLSGIIVWNYFSETFTTASKTFRENEKIFGKIYFPRLIVPLSKGISGFIKFLIQFAFFFSIYLYYLITTDILRPNLYLLLAPVLMLIIAGLGLGFGIIFTSLTSKYRDLSFLLQFGVQLFMYATPIIYPASSIPEKYKTFILLNPLTPLVEFFRYAFLGSGEWSWMGLAYSAGFMFLIFFLGILIFNRVEKTFMDTV